MNPSCYKIEIKGGRLVSSFHCSLPTFSVSETVNYSISGASVVESTVEVPRMDARCAESLVRKWQSVKSLALGPDHCLGKLSEVRITCTAWFYSYCISYLICAWIMNFLNSPNPVPSTPPLLMYIW